MQNKFTLHVLLNLEKNMPKTEIDKKVGRVLQGGKRTFGSFFPLGLRKTKEYKRCLLWYIICKLSVTEAKYKASHDYHIVSKW